MGTQSDKSSTMKPTPKVNESRKVRKPLMEKKRRARINQSLNDLKRLLLEANSVKKEGARPAKLEKADILELTVSHVQRLHQQNEDFTQQDDLVARFRAGFAECTRLVNEILQSTPCHETPDMAHRLSVHLQHCLQNITPATPLSDKSPSRSITPESVSSLPHYHHPIHLPPAAATTGSYSYILPGTHNYKPIFSPESPIRSESVASSNTDMHSNPESDAPEDLSQHTPPKKSQYVEESVWRPW